MEELATIREDERQELLSTARKMQELAADILNPDDFRKIKDILLRAVETEALVRGQFGLHPVLFDLQTALILAEEIGLNRASIISVLLHD